jgi:pyridoxine 5-phosphate synthase
VGSKLDLEMAATDEMIRIALDILPDLVTLVPEKRQELTTEGGLDTSGNKSRLKDAIAELHSKDIPVSLFVAPNPYSIDDAIELNADVIEIHTGKYANVRSEKDVITELSKINSISKMASEQGLIVTAGHGLNYKNIFPILNIQEIQEISIGHAIISRAVFSGLRKAVEDMVRIVKKSI